MMNKIKYLCATITLAVAFSLTQMPGYEYPSANGRTHDEAVISEDYGEHLGTVNFPISCSESAARHAVRGLALLYNMTYEGARAEFEASVKVEPDCGMGYWGQAMSFIHPLWSDPPSEADFRKGQMLVEKARGRGEKRTWEEAYIDAVGAYYDEGRNQSEKVNLAGFEKGWEKVYRKFPKDTEAASFYALAHMAIADPSDKTYARQKRAGEIVEQVLARLPNHPGAHHYIIHAYDYPELSDRALAVARNYGNLAPEVPHALHMPTHIFTRLGLWQESIDMNRRSAEAAWKHPADGAISLHYIHAIDYLVYAYLQQGEDEKAFRVMEKLMGLDGPFQVHIATAYPFAAVPARMTLERQKWVEASKLEARIPVNYPWDSYPAVEAITYFARTIGAARSGNWKVARQSLDKLETLREITSKRSAYWTQQSDIMRFSAIGWLTYEEGEREKALDIMQKAAALETTTEKHPVTPGEVLPARELLGDMLLEMGRYKEAQEAYETALDRSPNRFNSLYGAGRAAELGGNKKEALSFYRKLVEMTAKDSNRKRLKQVRAFLSKSQDAAMK